MRIFWKSRTVIVSKEGRVVDELPTMTAAAKKYGVHVQNIWATCNGTKTTLRGFTFKFEDKKKKDGMKRGNEVGIVTKKSKTVLVYKDGKLIDEVVGISNVARKYGVAVQNVWKTLNGYKTTLGGFLFVEKRVTT